MRWKGRVEESTAFSLTFFLSSQKGGDIGGSTDVTTSTQSASADTLLGCVVESGDVVFRAHVAWLVLRCVSWDKVLWLVRDCFGMLSQ